MFPIHCGIHVSLKTWDISHELDYTVHHNSWPTLKEYTRETEVDVDTSKVIGIAVLINDW